MKEFNTNDIRRKYWYYEYIIATAFSCLVVLVSNRVLAATKSLFSSISPKTISYRYKFHTFDASCSKQVSGETTRGVTGSQQESFHKLIGLYFDKNILISKVFLRTSSCYLMLFCNFWRCCWNYFITLPILRNSFHADFLVDITALEFQRQLYLRFVRYL